MISQRVTATESHMWLWTHHQIRALSSSHPCSSSKRRRQSFMKRPASSCRHGHGERIAIQQEECSLPFGRKSTRLKPTENHLSTTYQRWMHYHPCSSSKGGDKSPCCRHGHGERIAGRTTGRLFLRSSTNASTHSQFCRPRLDRWGPCNNVPRHRCHPSQ